MQRAGCVSRGGWHAPSRRFRYTGALRAGPGIRPPSGFAVSTRNSGTPPIPADAASAGGCGGCARGHRRPPTSKHGARSRRAGSRRRARGCPWRSRNSASARFGMPRTRSLATAIGASQPVVADRRSASSSASSNVLHRGQLRGNSRRRSSFAHAGSSRRSGVRSRCRRGHGALRTRRIPRADDSSSETHSSRDALALLARVQRADARDPVQTQRLGVRQEILIDTAEQADRPGLRRAYSVLVGQHQAQLHGESRLTQGATVLVRLGEAQPSPRARGPAATAAPSAASTRHARSGCAATPHG